MHFPRSISWHAHCIDASCPCGVRLPPRPLCAGTFLLERVRPRACWIAEKDQSSARVPDEDFVAHRARDQATLVSTKTARLEQPSRAEVEAVAVHRADDGRASALAIAQARTGMVACVLDGLRSAVDERDERVERWIVQPDQRAPFDLRA
jgi:hypothetical protein